MTIDPKSTQDTLLIVEDELLVARQLAQRLSQLGYAISGIVSSGQAALMAVFQTPPDLIIMDIVIKGEIDGIETASRIYESTKIPIIFLTALCNEDLLDRAQLSGSYGYMIKPVNVQELNATIKMVLNKHRQFQNSYKQGHQDSTTGIVNPIYLQEQIATEESRSKRTKQGIGVIGLSVDQLILIRKNYGYEGENYVLKQVSTHLNKTLRQTDLVYQTENSQILILLPNCSLENAKKVAEQIRADSHDLVAHYNTRQIWMSFSLGVTCYCPDSDLSLNQVIQSANSSLVKAQEQGGNRVVAIEI